jgi:hypothetical protein
MQQLGLRLLARPLTLALAAGCAAPLIAGCTGSAPAPTPTAAGLLASAAAALRAGRPCTVRGDVVLDPTRSYDSVSSDSAGTHFSATITRHLTGTPPLTTPEQLIDNGTALYFQSAAALQLAYQGKVPSGLAGRWIRFPSWPSLSHNAYATEVSKLSHYPGHGGAALTDLMLDTTTVPYQGGSCGLLLAQLRTQAPSAGRVASGKLDGRPVLTFTLTHVFAALSAEPYQITVSRRTPPRVLRVTSGNDALSLGYPATIAPISAPPAAEVIPAPQVPALSRGH